MKYATAYYLFLLYCTVLLRCAIPVVCDALSHICNEEEHMATIHAVYGNNHLQKEIASNETSTNKNATTVKYEEPVPVHIQANVFTVTDFIKEESQKLYCFTASRYLPVYLQQVFSPPKLS